MGLLIDGEWHDAWYDTKESRGRFVRTEAQFRNWVTRDGSAGPSGRGGFRAEPNRYHLYVAFACPWAHRTLIFRKLKGLDSLLSIAQMPAGVPVGTLAIGRAGATNAALLAIAILATTRPELREKLRKFRDEQTARVRADTLPPT